MFVKSIMVMEEKRAGVKAKRIPYGMMNRRTEQEQKPVCLSYALQEGGRTTDRLSNFIAVREDSCYYVDKTRFIEEVEVHSEPAYAGWVPPCGWFLSFSAWRLSIQAFSICQSPMVRCSESKLMPTFTMGRPVRENLEA